MPEHEFCKQLFIVFYCFIYTNHTAQIFMRVKFFSNKIKKKYLFFPGLEFMFEHVIFQAPLVRRYYLASWPSAL